MFSNKSFQDFTLNRFIGNDKVIRKQLLDYPSISNEDCENSQFIIFPEKSNDIGCKFIYSENKIGDLDCEEEENYRKKYNTHVASLQSWFIRIAHQEKLKFLLKLLDEFVIGSNTNVLLDMMDPITKDFIYAKTQFTNTKYDITPLDHNRCLTIMPLTEAQFNGLVWFAELKENDQIHVMIILLKLSGSAISFHFYLQAIKYLDHGEYKIEEDAELELMKYKFVRSILDKRKELRLLKLEELTKTRKMRNSPLRSQNVKSPASAASNTLEKNTKEWEKLFSELINEAGLFKGPRANDKHTTIAVDMVQLLPVSTNRYIYSFLDKKSKKNLKSVNKYWLKSSMDINKEENTRKALNRSITQKRKKLLKYKFKKLSWSSNHTCEEIPLKYSLPDDEKYKKKIKRKKIKMERLFSVSPSTNLLETKPKILMFQTLIQHGFTFKPPKDPYKGKFAISEICCRFDHTRCMVATYQWIAIGDGYNITLHRVLTGALSPGQLKGHTGHISALCFDKKRSGLFSGSCDTTIKYWDLYSRNIKASYPKHNSLIQGIAVDENYIASISMDKKLRILMIERCTVLWVYSFASLPVTIAIGSEMDIYLGLDDGAILKTVLKSGKPYDQCIFPAHPGGVSCLLFDKPFVITGGYDGYVRVWHHEHFDGPAIATLDHHGLYVSSVALSFMKVFTAADDGILRIWDIFDSTLKRKIFLNISRRPILNIVCLEIYDHTKILINNEDGLKVIEFSYDWIKLKKMCKFENKKVPMYMRELTRTTTRPDEFLFKLQYETIPKNRYDNKRCKDLLLRHPALPQMVTSESTNPVTIQEYSVTSRAVLGDHKLLLFPRILSKICSELVGDYKQKPAIEIERDGTLKVPESIRRYFPLSTKGILPSCNPSKRTI